MRRAFASVVVLVVAAVLSGGVGDGAIGSGAVGAGAVGNGAVGSPQRGEEVDAITALAPLIDYNPADLDLSSSDPISSWPNSGSLGSDWGLANAGASTTKPTYVTAAALDGVSSVVRFDGGDDIGTAVDAAAALAQTFTMVLVVKLAATGDEWGGCSDAGTCTNNWGIFDLPAGGGFCWRFGPTATTKGCHSTERPTVGAWETITIQASGASSQVCISGNCDTDDGGTGSISDWSMGRTSGVGIASGLDADVARWFVLDGIVSDATIRAAVDERFPQ